MQDMYAIYEANIQLCTYEVVTFFDLITIKYKTESELNELSN